MKVIEIFDSIDGEGLHAGGLATFIRLAGCNMACRYCDTKYSWAGGESMTVRNIVEKVEKLGNNHVTITGGEPLIHTGIKGLINQLRREGYAINVETNGSIDVEPFRSKGCTFTVDYKLPSAGDQAHSLMDLRIWDKLTRYDAIKFVCNKGDFDTILKVLKRSDTKAQILISPIYGEVELKDIVELLKTIKEQNLAEDARMQVQLHKLIWEPDARGV